MKKVLLLSVLLAIIALVTFASSRVSAQQVQQYANAIELAQAFLSPGSPVDHFNGIAWGTITTPSNQSSVQIDFIMSKSLWITNMSVNGTNIPLAQPLGGLPIPANGYTSFTLQLQAVDALNDDWISEGYTNINYLPAQSSLNITMYPHFPPIGIPVTLNGADPSSIQVQVTGANGADWYYDPTLGEVVIMPNYSAGNNSYTITDSSGVIAHGTLPYFQGSSGSVAENTVINPQQAGNVLEADVDGANNWFSDLKFDCQVPDANNAPTAAKVFDVPDLNYQSALEVYVYGVAGSTIEILGDDGNGNSPMVSEPITVQSTSTDPSFGWTIVSTSQYLGKAVVVVLPPSGTNQPANFQVGVYRYYPPSVGTKG